MALSRTEILERNFAACVRRLAGCRPAPLDRDAPLRSGSSLTVDGARRLARAMLTSRALDLEARRLKHLDLGYYTIGSAGHEGNAVLGELLRATDPCFLHYRSGGFMMARALRFEGETPIRDTILSFLAAASDPVSGGRHKVWGSRRLWVPPQTSTIATQIPKATGMAFGLERGRRLRWASEFPADAIVACTFGDATINHAVALSGFNTAAWAVHQNLPVPILYVCEDNGIGISVKTPPGWVEARLRTWPGIAYVQGDGLDVVDAYDAASRAIDFVRRERRPAFLHLRTVRLLGHAGSDVETEYRTLEEIEATEAEDPLLRLAETLVESGAMAALDLEALWHSIQADVRAEAEACVREPKLTSLAAVVAPLAPYHEAEVTALARAAAPQAERERAFGGPDRLPERQARPRPLAMLVNWALRDLLCQYPEMLLFGEDVAKKGGVYHVTAGLSDSFGVGRVFNTLLDETSILGLAIGLGHAGALPVPEIQYLAYLHNAEDELRGEAGSMQFFSNGQFRNPMVVRVASFAYQKGFGGHFHNDNSIGVLRDIPGIVLAAPSRGDDAVGMLRTCMALAKADGRVVVFLEPIALYHEKDLLTEGDGGWQCKYPEPGMAVPLGESRLYTGEREVPAELVIVSYGNALRLSLQAAHRLWARGRGVRVLDLRWLAPLDLGAVEREALACGRVLVVDECRRTGGGVAEALLASLAENPRTFGVPIARLTAADTYLPLGPAAKLCLPSTDEIEAAAIELLQAAARPRIPLERASTP